MSGIVKIPTFRGKKMGGEKWIEFHAKLHPALLKIHLGNNSQSPHQNNGPMSLNVIAGGGNDQRRGERSEGKGRE